VVLVEDARSCGPQAVHEGNVDAHDGDKVDAEAVRGPAGREAHDPAVLGEIVRPAVKGDLEDEAVHQRGRPQQHRRDVPHPSPRGPVLVEDKVEAPQAEDEACGQGGQHQVEQPQVEQVALQERTGRGQDFDVDEDEEPEKGKEERVAVDKLDADNLDIGDLSGEVEHEDREEREEEHDAAKGHGEPIIYSSKEREQYKRRVAAKVGREVYSSRNFKDSLKFPRLPLTLQRAATARWR